METAAHLNPISTLFGVDPALKEQQHSKSESPNFTAASSSLLDMNEAEARILSPSGDITHHDIPLHATATAAAAAPCPPAATASGNVKRSSSTTAAVVPPFLAKLFEQERLRRIRQHKALNCTITTRTTTTTTSGSGDRTRSSTTGSASRQDSSSASSNISNTSTTSSAAAICSNILPNVSPSSDSAINLHSNTPGLIYSASSVASSDTSSFHADSTTVGGGSLSSSSSILPPTTTMMTAMDMPNISTGFSSSISPITTTTNHNNYKKAPLTMLPSYAATYHNYPKPQSHYDYAASSASSTGGGDDTFGGGNISENGSIASRSASPAMKSSAAAGGIGGGNNSVTNYSYSSPTTSPFFHHYQNSHHNPHYTHIHANNSNSHHNNHFHQHLHQQHLYLQPLKLPPPSLDLHQTPSTSLSSRTASCDTLSTAALMNGNSNGNAAVQDKNSSGSTIDDGRRTNLWTTSPQAYPNSSTADTSQTTTPGVALTEMSFSPLHGGGFTSRSAPRQQHYSPLHPFHQQGLMSPQRPPGLYTSLGLLAPETESHHGPFLCPPDNFAMVSPNVYRSSFPSAKNFDFLKTLHLKTVLILVQEEEYPQVNKDFFKSQKIRYVTIGIPGNKVSHSKLHLLLACADRNHNGTFDTGTIRYHS